MASNTAMSSKRRKIKSQNAGRKRKNKESRKSTPSATELFAGMGEPGKAAPKGGAKPAAKAKAAAKPAAKAAKPAAASVAKSGAK